ncbi:thioredoxin family protein [Mangrovibacterium diazotrophicum]|uniref:Small redox-active disulfide protein 2 n=1 Tax=Mangrovibacterium diazotrophicum TaxID=1261403 RepID=A0A419WAJ3_9BACT|nr:thioredoxin family protein [Mangrovibacterium diazotrophicum]RKD92444.1 small redox-active disulfide protein 2 [Mangrovibacterium diazotrophicum]
MEIEVLGPGCVRCRGLDSRVRKAVAELQLDARVTKVEDLTEIMRLGILQTPGLVIDGKVVMSGKLPTYTELKEFLKQYQLENL